MADNGEVDFSIYDSFLREADKDNRVGLHKFMVTDKSEGVFPSGDTYTKVRGTLITAGKAKADCDLRPLPSKEELEAIKASGDPGRQRGVAMNINIIKGLAKHYSKSVESLDIGDTFYVETYKDKNGFIRVNHVVDPKVAEAKLKVASEGKTAGAGSSVPF